MQTNDISTVVSDNVYTHLPVKALQVLFQVLEEDQLYRHSSRLAKEIQRNYPVIFH